MSPWQVARLYALKSLWSVTGLRRAGRVLLDVQSGKRAEPLIAEAIARREHLPTLLIIAGDIGATALEPELRRFTTDPDPAVARAARDGLRILGAQRRS